MARAEGEFADIYAAGWVSHLRKTLASEALRLGIKDLDVSSLQSAEPRRLTQLASRQAYKRGLSGLYYLSRYGNSLDNWALFEPACLLAPASLPVFQNDPDFVEALRLHRLTCSATD